MAILDPMTAGVGKAVASAVDSASAEVSKTAGNLLSRLLGPVTDEMGAALAEMYKTANVKRVAAKAAKKARLDDEGRIPPRVAAQVLDAAQWAENEFVAEYLSGVLASSRTLGGTSDSGVSWSALIARLSSDNLKLHLAIYAALQGLVEGMQLERVDGLLSKWIWIDQEELFAFAKFESDSSFRESIYTLRAEDLLDRTAHGSGSELGKFLRPARRIEGLGIAIQVSVRGISLYFQAFGLGDRWARDIVKPELRAMIELPDELGPVPKARWLNDFPIAEE